MVALNTSLMSKAIHASSVVGGTSSQEEVQLGDQIKTQGSWVNCWGQNTVGAALRASKVLLLRTESQSLSILGTTVLSGTFYSWDGLHVCISRTQNLLEERI